MIPKYRNKGIALLVLACLLTALLAYLIAARSRNTGDLYLISAFFLYLGTWAAWIMASFSFAKAKAYSSGTSGGIFLFLIVVSFCVPLAAFLFPFIVLFGLPDKSGSRRRRR